MGAEEVPFKTKVRPSPDTICAQALDFPGDFALPRAGALRDEDVPKHPRACTSPDSRAVGFTPAAVLVTNVVLALIALVILLPPMSEASFNAVAAAAALSPVAVSLLSGPAVRLASGANLAALLLLDCVLAAVASATVLPLLPGATLAACAFARNQWSRLLPAVASLGWVDAWALAPVCTAGFAAQLVDGSLGMGYGLTSATVLTAAGLSPATASSSVHLAQLGTTLVSGLAHHRHGNVDMRAMARLSPAGAAGALVGALLLSSVPIGAAKLVSGSLLFFVGAGVLLRFLFSSPPDCDDAGVHKPDPAAEPPSQADQPKHPAGKSGRLGAHLAPLGFVGGFVDATGGGGWGPVAMSTLLADGKLCPARIIGTTSASEFFVTVAAVAGFAISALATHFAQPQDGVAVAAGAAHGAARLDMVAALLLGGVAAAPLAPFLTTAFRPRVLGVTLGGFICFTNVKSVQAAFYTGGVPRDASRAAHALLVAGWLAALGLVAKDARNETRRAVAA